MGHKLIAQILLVIVSVVIIFTYIKPTFADIKNTQDELYEYNDALAKASEFNQRLRELIAIENSFSRTDLTALDKFLATSINDAQVMRDLENIAFLSGVTLDSVSAGELSEGAESGVVVETVDAEMNNLDDENLVHQDFELSVSATYEDIKNFLARVEANDYVLEIISLELGNATAEDGGEEEVVVNPADQEYPLELTLRVYAFNEST